MCHTVCRNTEGRNAKNDALQRPESAASALHAALTHITSACVLQAAHSVAVVKFVGLPVALEPGSRTQLRKVNGYAAANGDERPSGNCDRS